MNMARPSARIAPQGTFVMLSAAPSAHLSLKAGTITALVVLLVLGRSLVPEARITLLMAPPALLTVGRARPDGSVPQTRQTPQRRSKFAQPATIASKELKLP